MRDPGVRGIVSLLRSHERFRLLWYGQAVSALGDWLNHVAVMTLLLKLTGSGKMIAASLILRMLPSLFVAPLAGVIVDRFDRRRIMILSDVLRGALVPFFMLVRDPSFVPLIYGLVFLQVTISAFFEPARSAVLPNLVTKEELLSANALMSVTWSLTLAFGSAIGGFVIAAFGTDVAFAVDSLTFFASATFIGRIAIESRPRHAEALSWTRGFVDLKDGLAYVVRERAVGSLVLVKSGVGLAGGMVLLLTVLGDHEFSVAGEAAAGIGLLFGARGIGTALGPFAGRAISAYHEPAMRRLIGFGFLQAALFLLLFSRAERLWVALVLLLCAHLGTSVNWVFSTVLLQLKVPDELRGRVFSAELALFTVVFCAVTYGTGFALDELGWSPRTLTALAGGSLIVPGALWLGALVNARRRVRV